MGVVETAQEAANTVADGVTYAVDQYWNNGVFTNGYYNINPAGVLVLAVHLIITFVYILYVWGRKTWNRWWVCWNVGGCCWLRPCTCGAPCDTLDHRQQRDCPLPPPRKKMNPVAAGMFRLAAARGEIDKLEILQKARGFNINADVEGWTALHAAAAMAQPGVVLYSCVLLLSNLLSFMLTIAYMTTLLPNNTDAVAWLLAHGANLHLHKEDSWRDTVLHYAAAAGSLDCCKILLAFGSDPRAKNFAGVLMMGEIAAMMVYNANIFSCIHPPPYTSPPNTSQA